MFDFLRKIQDLPEKKKRVILWASTVGITFFLVLVWLILSQTRFFQKEENQAAAIDLSPFQVIKARSAEMFGGLKQQYTDIKGNIGF